MSRYSLQQVQDQVLIARVTGAERERRRIRRAQAKALKKLGEHIVAGITAPVLVAAHRAFDDATRAPRAKRRRGK